MWRELTYRAITVVTGLTTVYCNTPNLHLHSKTLQRTLTVGLKYIWKCCGSWLQPWTGYDSFPVLQRCPQNCSIGDIWHQGCLWRKPTKLIFQSIFSATNWRPVRGVTRLWPKGSSNRLKMDDFQVMKRKSSQSDGRFLNPQQVN